MRYKSNIFVVCMAFLTLFGSCARTTAARDSEERERTVRVMTRNLDAGSDFGYVIQAASDPNATQLQLLLAISGTFQEMVDSDIPGRAEEIAQEILKVQPDLIGLQEVTTLRAGLAGQPADTVLVDGLRSLQHALLVRGLHYEPVALQTNASVDLPALDSSFSPITVGFTDYDAVLARTDLPARKFKISNVEMQHYSTILPFTVAGRSFPFLRGWISLQITSRGRAYKFVTTHLETFSPDIQAAQTNELIGGPLNTDLSVILAGDLNSDAHQPSWADGPAFQMLESAGLQDVWSKLHTDSPGLTWPLFAEDPPGKAALRQRIDLIMVCGDAVAGNTIERTGLFPSASGKWGSDHTGVFGTFDLYRFWDSLPKQRQ